MNPLREADAQRSSRPDKSGTLQGYAWAAWWNELDYKSAGGVWDYVVYDPDGECVKRWRNVGGTQSRWVKWRHFHPVTDYSLETHVETEILCYVLRRADYTPLPETIVRWTPGDFDEVMRRHSRRERRRNDKKRTARFYGCAPEQVSHADLKAWRRRGQEMAKGSFAH